MKKLSLLIGTIGGALAGYVFSKSDLRDELSKVKDPEEAAKILGKHLSKDGKKLGKDVMNLVESPEMQKNFKKAKSYAQAQYTKAKDEVQGMISSGVKTAKKEVKNAKKAVKKAV